MPEIKTAVMPLQSIKAAAYNARVQLEAKDQQYQALRGSMQ